MALSGDVQVPELAPEKVATPLAPDLVDQLLDPVGDHGGLEAEEAVGLVPGEALPEAGHGVPGVGVALPAVGGVGLDDDPGSLPVGGPAVVPEDAALVVGGLGVEEALAGEGDDAGAQAVGVGEEAAGLHGEGHF